MIYDIALCHPDEVTNLIPKSSGRLNYFQYLIRITQLLTVSHLDDSIIGSIPSARLLDTAVCHPDDISYRHMPSGWLSWSCCLIRMSYKNVIMSSGRRTLPFLSHPDKIANFDFSQRAVVLQRFRSLILCGLIFMPLSVEGRVGFGKASIYDLLWFP